MDLTNKLPLRLPTYSRSKKMAVGENGWSENYGATIQAAKYADTKIKSPIAFQGFWQHGCFGPWDMEIPESLTYYNQENFKNWPVLVARKDEEIVLRKQGLHLARAIGLPIVYAEPIAQPHIPNSLLIVPTHTMSGMQFPNSSDFVRYADQLKIFVGKFDYVAACIHPSCWKNRLWLDEFRELGLPIIKGADGTDQNSLCRMKTLFRSFQNVTSNGWGSHIAYALAENARVSIYGTQPMCSADEMRKVDATTRDNFQSQSYRLSPEFAAKRKRHLERYYTTPDGGVSDIEYGRYLIGSDNKISTSEMKEVLRLGYQCTLRESLKARGQALERKVKQFFRNTDLAQ
jgi:hypothetical protein